MKPQKVAKLWHMVLVYVIAWYGPALLWVIQVPRKSPYILAVLGGEIYAKVVSIYHHSDPYSLPCTLVVAGALLSCLFPLGTTVAEWSFSRKYGYSGNRRGVFIIILVIFSFIWHAVAVLFISV